VPTRLLAAVALVVFPVALVAQDGIAPAVVESVKKSSVFVRLEGDGWGATGSGFVVAGNDKELFVATNEHVVANSPPPGVRAIKPPTVSVVFDSGTKTERSFPAMIAAADAERDLAILKISGVKTPPPALQLNDGGKLTETMTVYSFGFPFGKALSSDDKSPAITVGKASVSSLRNGPDGDLQVIQIDGNLNPGNSGGPVVDVKGKLVGVAVATLRDGQGIGFVIPAKDVAQMIQGRVGRVRLVPQKSTDGKVTSAKLEATIDDAMGNVRSATVRYVVVPATGKRPQGDSLARVTDAKTATLKIANGVASADIPLAATDGELLVQVTLETTTKQTVSSKVRGLSLAAVVVGGPPPSGWKEYAPLDRTFTAWVPSKPTSQSDNSRTRAVNGKLLTVNAVTGESASGLTYEAQSVLLLGAFGRAPKRELAELFRDLIAKDLEGKVTDTQEVDVGALPGIESVIVSGKTTTRLRVFAAATGVYIASVSGSADLAASKEATTFLAAFRPAEAGFPGFGGGMGGGIGGPSVGGPGVVAPAPKADGPPIYGGFNDPVFTDVAPEGGLLIGLEVGTAPAFGRNMTRAVRPIYRVNKNTVFGDQQGTQLDDVVSLKAKDGYAVGAVSVMHGLGFDGIKVTFMKVVDGTKLDPKDCYDSEYVGSDEKKALTKIGGDGTPVVGITGKANDKDLTGFGLLLKGQEPKKK
jgi:S1-C subfamily serine protease